MTVVPFPSSPNSERTDFGVSAVAEDGKVSLVFDLDRIEAFQARLGNEVFVRTAMQYVKQRAEVLGAADQLWLWRDAIEAL